ncbi:ornithine decarboxylase antizyme-domain-containing protein [Coniella lustricola]|uniref:Ornithine decarboxylase antizyme n=1 Tax=Coniella lustricola TaxID=2025994 RepID=A0A2T2ZT90_9PEZI|nr:ornithine decarboxylase antizyme-domain-containing protein [Coniella lustricola]
MAPMKTLNQSNQYNSRYGEDVARQANVLASCYVVDAAGSLKGLHYCTTLAAGAGIPEVPISGLPSPPSSPPLAAFTSDNELAIQPKPKRNNTTASALGSTGARTRRGGATLRIREECERFFCEIMKVVFHGEMDPTTHGSGLTSVYHQQHHQQHSDHHNLPSPDQSPSHRRSPDGHAMASRSSTGVEAIAWMEIWDFQGGASFLAFVAEDFASGEKSLFTFFDAGVVGCDLKKALVALIELADAPLGCSRLVVCIDRAADAEDLQPLTKGLQWAGFELDTLDQWASIRDVTSSKWLFMGMDI